MAKVAAKTIQRSDWFAERRLDYIDFRILRTGTLRRVDVMDAFGVSETQASLDINEFIRRYPEALVYDKSAKQYVPAGRYRSQRELGKRVLEALTALAETGHPMGWS